MEVMQVAIPFSENAQARIEIVECHDEWFVRLMKGGVEKTEIFSDESLALGYAEKLRARLKLEKIGRI